jgi:hypothetical protein
MKEPRFRIDWLMAFVAISVLDVAVLREVVV